MGVARQGRGIQSRQGGVEAFVDFHTFLFGGCRDKCIDERLLQVSGHYVELLACHGGLEYVFVQHVYHFHGGKGFLAVLKFIFKHANHTFVV